MKKIDTLVDDIHDLFDPETESLPITFPLHYETFAHNVMKSLQKYLGKREEREPALYMSSIGRKCKRQLWYMMNKPEVGEKLRPATYLKFFFGDFYEELLLLFAKTAGHTVTGEQDSLVVNDLRGRRDAVIDGRLVDIKSASSRSFDKFEDIDQLRDNDPFGYLPQLDLYLHASKEDPLVEDKDCASFFAVDKQMGKLTLATVPKRDVDYEVEIQEIKDQMALEEPPERPFMPIADGKSGNYKLPVNCSYCDFKQECWPGLRTFIYSNGPRYLTTVERIPDVTEVT